MRSLFLILALASTAAAAPCLGPLCPSTPPTPSRPFHALPMLEAATVRVINIDTAGRSLGSGAVIADDGSHALVLTCGHLFREGTKQVVVFRHDGRSYGARILGIDENADLALLHVRSLGVTPLELADRSSQPGAQGGFAGYGSNGRLRAITGRILAPVRLGDHADVEALQIAGAARQGDSGGPVINAAGKLIGIVVGTDGQTVVGPTCSPIRTFVARFQDILHPPVGRAPQESASPPSNPPESEPTPPTSNNRPAPQTNPASPPRPPSHAPQPRPHTPLPTLPSTTLPVWLPFLLAALGITLPPTVAILLPLAIRICKRRLRKRRRQRDHISSSPPISKDETHESTNCTTDPPAATPAQERRLSDDYAAQLAGVFAQSGRSPLQDATLGREYSREIAQAIASSDTQRSDWAKKIESRVQQRFHRIHGFAPTPAEPVA